jgi:hypothetical protein
MSWLFSQALVEEFLADGCSGGEPFAQLNVMPTPHKFWSNDKTMEPSNLSRFGLTLRLLTEQDGEAVLMSYLEASPARISVAPARAPESTENAAECGGRWQGSLAKYDPDTHSLKTAQCSLLEDLTGCCVTLPRWGSMRNGALYLRKIPALHTAENASGLWPTPDASCGRRGWSRTVAEQLLTGNRERKSGAKIGSSLAWEPRLLPEYSPGARLNPDWLEWLMGWPIAHTALLPLETAKFREWRQQHSVC